MSCKKEWNYHHLEKQFTKTFMKGTGKYKENGGYDRHFSEVLMKTELSFFDESSKAIDLERIELDYEWKRYSTYLPHPGVTDKWVFHLKKKRREKCICKRGQKNCVCVPIEEKLEYSKKMEEVLFEIAEHPNKMIDLRTTLKNKFIKMIDEFNNKSPEGAGIQKCMKADCDGFLTDGWSCRKCHNITCKSCLTIKTDGHECDIETIETIQKCLKETKPCPKCHQRIQKADGCDQMFCTQCDTIFSWNTGTIQFGGWIHAPDAINRMRETGTLNRDVRDVQCGGTPDINEIIRKINKVNHTEGGINWRHNFIDDIRKVVNLMKTYESRVLPFSLPKTQYSRNLEDRKKFITGRISRKTFLMYIFDSEMFSMKRQEEYKILNGWFIATGDMLRNFTVLKKHEEWVFMMKHIKIYIDVINDSITKNVSEVYGRSSYRIDLEKSIYNNM
jgi:hypothetical protein